jgi:ATP-dependent RNA helicase RhlE
MVTPPAKTADRVKQCVMFVDRGNKRKLLDRLLADPERSRVLVFVRTKHGADRLYKSLIDDGVAAEGIHGGRSQNARQRVLNDFRSGKIRVLIATDIAARGIDIDEISHVVNFDVPLEADAYVHRIGRTARAGASGESITFCAADEYKYFKQIEKTIGMRIEIDREHPFHSVDAQDGELSEFGDLHRPKKSSNAKNSTAEPTKRRRSISGKVRKVKPKPTRPSTKSYKKRSSPKSKRR